MRPTVGIFVVALAVLASKVALGDAPGARRVTATVLRVDRANGHVSVLADGQHVDVQFPRAKVRRLKRGDRIAVWLPGRLATPTRTELRGDPGPPAAEVPPPAGYPLGPGMGPIGAGSPNAGPGSPVGADGAR